MLSYHLIIIRESNCNIDGGDRFDHTEQFHFDVIVVDDTIAECFDAIDSWITVHWSKDASFQCTTIGGVE
jgi:hypothetical protein